MDTEDQNKAIGCPRAVVVGSILSVVGVALPLCLLIGAYPLVKHGRAMTDQELVLALLCSFLFLVLEFVALAYGLAARRTVLGKVVVGISGVLLGLSSILVAFGLAVCFANEAAGWPLGTTFGVVLVAVLLVISLCLLGLFRAKWLS
jgi:hypothetical protein